jgi:CRISPR-associated protein Csx14
MSRRDSAIQVKVDLSNPGHFFACCGLLELADRLWGGAEGWFNNGLFLARSMTEAGGTLQELVQAVSQAELRQLDADNDMSSSVEMSSPFGLRLDWWQETDDQGRGSPLKVWAGSMRNVRIARAMQHALRRPELQTDQMFDQGMVVYDPDESDKKVEPFYFDSRRGSNALSLDIGFGPDALQMTTAAYPAVEFLCLVGLQRCRPMPTDKGRVFHYYAWSSPLSVAVLPAAVAGLLVGVGVKGFRFESAFRTDQKKHKALLPATPLGAKP